MNFGKMYPVCSCKDALAAVVQCNLTSIYRSGDKMVSHAILETSTNMALNIDITSDGLHGRVTE